MRVLLVSRYVPWPLRSGAAVRSFALVQGLATRFEIALAMSDPGDADHRAAAEAAYAPFVREFIWVPVPLVEPARITRPRPALVRALLSVFDLVSHWLPLSFREASAPWTQTLANEAPRFDAIICRYAWLAPALFAIGLKHVVVDMDCVQFLYHWRELKHEATPLQRIRGPSEVFREWLSEQTIGLRSAHILTCSNADAKRFWTSRKTVVPNGMTVEPGQRATMIADTITFVGACASGPNHHGLAWFIRQVFPQILASRPQTRLRIVGGGATLDALPFAVHPQIDLVPDVPSVRSWYESSVVTIAPIWYSAGTRVTVVESLGYGTPVVATPHGATGLSESFDASHGLFVCADAGSLAQRLIEILDDPREARSAAARGAALVAQRFTWDRTVRALVDGLESWVAGATRASRRAT